MKFYIYLSLLFVLVSLSFSSIEVESINVPTAEIIDYGSGGFYVRMYSYGGVITRFIFGPLNRLNFGGSIDIDKLIGYETPKIKEPAFYFKWRIFDGTRYFPAFAIGYDGQSYSFSSSGYLPAKGLFLVFTQNVFSEFFIDFGVNFVRYRQDNELFGFVSFRFSIEDVIGFAAEYENIPKSDIGQLNCKIEIVPSRNIFIDFIFNKINSDRREIERQVRISYLYKFF